MGELPVSAVGVGEGMRRCSPWPNPGSFGRGTEDDQFL